MLVATLCYIVAFREKYDYANGLLNIVFVVIGYYFGSKRQRDRDEDDESQSQSRGKTISQQEIEDETSPL